MIPFLSVKSVFWIPHLAASSIVMERVEMEVGPVEAIRAYSGTMLLSHH